MLSTPEDKPRGQKLIQLNSPIKAPSIGGWAAWAAWAAWAGWAGGGWSTPPPGCWSPGPVSSRRTAIQENTVSLL